MNDNVGEHTGPVITVECLVSEREGLPIASQGKVPGVSPSPVPVRPADEPRADRVAELGRRLVRSQLTIGVAESLTGGLVVQEMAKCEGSGEWLRGGVVAYATGVKRDLLGVTAAKVVSESAAAQMADGVLAALGADVAVAVTGVAGPSTQDGEPPGTVWIGIADGRGACAELLHASGGPEEICQRTIDAVIDRLLTWVDA